MGAYWICNCRHPNTKVWYADEGKPGLPSFDERLERRQRIIKQVGEMLQRAVWATEGKAGSEAERYNLAAEAIDLLISSHLVDERARNADG